MPESKHDANAKEAVLERYRKGIVQVYTGNGKGKTTAALGLALRASGAGKKVFIGQFLKCGRFSELNALKKIKNITVEQFGKGCFMKKATREDILREEAGLKRIEEALGSRKFGLIILDEINVSVSLGLLEEKAVLRVLNKTPKEIELVLTGRNAPRSIIKAADLVSRIDETKHYFDKGIKARKGIEF
jgi:cob(I)alamin adenosyltransferase